MIRIAVLGDIGSGKSYVAKQFGYPVFNADIEVAKIYRKNRNCYNKLKKILPKYIISFPIILVFYKCSINHFTFTCCNFCISRVYTFFN